MPDEAPLVFRENPVSAVTFAALAVLFLVLGEAKLDSEWTFVGAVLMATAVVWLMPLRLELHPDRIGFRSLFRSVDMRPEDIEFFYYRQQSTTFLRRKVGASLFRYRLIDNRGRKINFGARMKSPQELGAKLIEYTTPPLLRKCSQKLDMGHEVDFGWIRVSRTEGVKVRKPRRFGFGTYIDQIPLDQVSEYAMRKGYFYIWRKGEKFTRGPLVHNVANVFVLEKLLDRIYGKGTSAKAAG